MQNLQNTLAKLPEQVRKDALALMKRDGAEGARNRRAMWIGDYFTGLDAIREQQIEHWTQVEGAIIDIADAIREDMKG